MKSAIISGDINASTSLNDVDRKKVGKSLQLLTKNLNAKYSVYSRTIEGDDSIVLIS